MNERARPDLLIEGRVFDTYTPVVDNLDSIWSGIEQKIARKQTHRVVVDLRNTTQTDRSLREALRAKPIPDLKEIATLSSTGIGRAFP